MSEQQRPRRRELPGILQALIVVILLPLLIPLVLVWLTAYFLYGIALQVVVWLRWCTRGVNVLLVYSESPH